MPVSNISVVGVRSSTVGRRAVDRPALLVVDGSPQVDRVAEHVEDAAERAAPTGTVIGPPVSMHLGAAREAVRRVHRDRAHAVVAEVLLHLAARARRCLAAVESLESRG